MNLPDLSAPSAAGRVLEETRERVAATRYEQTDVDLGKGAFGGAAGASGSTDNGDTLDWRAGDRVRHRRVGDGIVVSSLMVKGDEEVTVAFVGQGVKRLIAAYAGLERA